MQVAEQAWKTVVEGTEPATCQSAGPKFTVTQRCRAENEQRGQGQSCGAAVARRRVAAKKKSWAANVAKLGPQAVAGKLDEKDEMNEVIWQVERS